MREKIQLYHGDCLEIMAQLIAEGVKVDAIIVDPPYGTTACSWDEVIPMDAMWERVAGLSKPTTPAIIFGTEPFSSMLRVSNIKEYRYDWVWEKEQGTNQFLKNKQPLRKHENISVFYREQTKFNKVTIHSWRREVKFRQETNNEVVGYESKEKTEYDSKGLKHPVTVLPFNRPHWREGRYHTTQKPLNLMRYLVQTYTDEGDVVLDFTMGSGTTGVVCREIKRGFIGIEKDAGYYQTARERIESVGK